MLIVEHFFLIACDPRTGLPHWPHTKQNPDTLAAAALLLGLALHERITFADARLHVDASLPLSHPLLNEALRILNQTADHSVAATLRILMHRMAPLPEQVLDGLHRRDLVHRIQTRRWLIFKNVRYPLRSMQSRNEALDRLRAAARAAREDLHGLALLLLAEQSGLLAAHLDAYDHERASQRLLELGDRENPRCETRRVYSEVRCALLA